MPQKKSEQPIQFSTASSNDETKPILNDDLDKSVNQEPLETTPVLENTLNERSLKRRRRTKRGKWVWLGILGMLVITAIGAAIGYGSGMQARKNEDATQRQLSAATQYELALQDQKEGRLDIARQRFEFVLKTYPEYPGIEEKLVEVGMAIAQGQGGSAIITPQVGTTSIPVITSDPEVNTQSLAKLLRQATSQYVSQDWKKLYATVIKIRDINPKHNAAKIDGYYYAALRNLGISEITAGNLEVGLYYISLAEQIGPIDTETASYSIWARMYLTAGSWWGINWPNTIEKFAELYAIVPNLQDSSRISVRQRYARAFEGYGDFLQMTYEWCAAVPQFENAASIVPSGVLTEKILRGQKLCENPPATPTPTVDPYAPTPAPTKKPKNN